MNFVLSILLQISVLSQLVISEPPTKPLAELSNNELTMLLKTASNEIKAAEMRQSLETNSTVLNGQVLVAFGEDIFYENYPGYTTLRSPGAHNRIDSLTVIELASISKQFTAAAILKLAQNGQLSLGDTITKYLPQLPYRNITIHQLLTHTAGIVDYIDLETALSGYHALNNEQLVQFFGRQRPKILSQPGTTFDYINTNYAFLASIVEKVSGESFTNYIHKEIFAPANMEEVYFFTEIDSLPTAKYAKGHLWNKREVPFHSMNYTLGDKGVYATVKEMYNWYLAYFINYNILPKEWVDLACTPHAAIEKRDKEDKSEYKYGYGLRIEESPKFGKLVYHGGLWRGFHNIMVYRPEDQLFVIFLSNFRNKAHVGKCDQLMGIIDGA